MIVNGFFLQERNGLLARRLRQRQRLLPVLRDVQRKQPAQNAADNDEAAATDAADDVTGFAIAASP